MAADDLMLTATVRVWDATIEALTPTCTCGGRGICTVCVLASFDAGEDADETLLECCACGRFSIFRWQGRGYCPHCGSGDTGVTRAGHDSWPDRADIVKAAN